MRRLLIWILLLSSALAACATTPASDHEPAGCEVPAGTVSFEDACQQKTSLIALCDAGTCGLYRCAEVMKFLPAGKVVPARGGGLALPGAPGTAQRNWGSAQELPWDSRPVLIIPWGPKPPLLPSQLQALKETEEERNKPHEKHHIFPRAFKAWFTDKEIDIDEYVIPLTIEKHRSIHRGASGGPWNAAWDAFIRKKGNATPAEIYRYAGQLIYEFELFGPVVPYWRQPIQPVPPGY